MIRKLMILTLIGLVGYIFYAQFVADSLEPFMMGFVKKPVFYQIRDPKIAAVDPSLQIEAGSSGAPEENAGAAENTTEPAPDELPQEQLQ